MTDSGRVRVAARLRPRNAEELILDADFNDCVELLPEVIIIFFSCLFYVLKSL
jgi:kinesin family protein 5